MAAALVGGAFLSGFIEVVLDKLLSPEDVHLIRGNKLDQELLERLELVLRAAKALLIDAEKKQFHDKGVKDWLDGLKDAVYTADDLLDHVFTEAATTQNKQVSNFLSRFPNFNFKDRKIVTKVEEIVRRIEAIEKRKYILGLKETPKENLSGRTQSTSLVKGEIYGRENDKDAIIKLLKDENTEANISVIPIVGMGGVGKTTLAQWLYNNKDLTKEFDLKAWVCVSEEFEIVKVTQTIIEAVTGTPCDTKNLNLLHHDLDGKLTGKKFFIVLDDVWNEAYGDWNNLKTPFQHGIRGSKILVTTRSEKVASVVQTCPSYLLNELSDEYCWSVFANHACFPESNGNPTLEKIGREIVKKCKGLPLAAQTLGGLLRVKHDVKEWNNILTTEIWNFSVEHSEIVPALLISYYHLPPHSKRCFVYCSLYPKDYEFDKDELILLWMAEGLLPAPESGKTLEEVGYDCFDDLASRLFFKQSSTYDDYFVMHDLMHDLATYVAGEFNFRSEELGNAHEMSTRKMITRTRHLSYRTLSHLISKDSIGRIKSLRTLLPIGFSTRSFSFGSTALVILSELKCLRVLSFAKFRDGLDVLPDSIGELIHLRYLDLSWTSIKTLPESLSNLYNLQTLKLIGCYKLTMLPSGMQNLVNLRHLDIGGTKLKEMPGGMSKLKHLQHLDEFVVGEHEEENGIMGLGELSNIHGSLIIRKLENVGCSSEALKARIMDKRHIETLVFEWSTGGDMATSSQMERDILDKLQPHKGLQELRIEGYRGTIFPNWVGHSSYHNIAKVSLMSCSNCCMLPSLGQLPSLESLYISNCCMLPSLGQIPSLESLCISNCCMLTFMGDLDSFPKLKYLSLEDCVNLESLPVSQPQDAALLIDLQIRGCPNLVSFPREGLVAPSMSYFSVSQCMKLESLPCHMNTLLPKLERLLISDCPEIEMFPDGGLPPNLKSLVITDCEKLLLSGLSSMGLHQGLTVLYIGGPCESVKSFPKQGSLPHLPSLTNLELYELSSLETLDCKELLHLTSLQELSITRCPKLENMTGDRLPASLIRLVIKDCPLLGERCNMKDPQIWPIISRIPTVEVNWRRIT